MKVTVTPPTEPVGLTLGNMEPGSFCRDRDGNIYFCTSFTATCLTDYGRTLQNRSMSVTEPVTRIRSGSTITIVVD